MKIFCYLVLALLSCAVYGCDDEADSHIAAGSCQDSVKLLVASSSANERVCPKGALLEVLTKEQSIVAICRCIEGHPVLDAGLSK